MAPREVLKADGIRNLGCIFGENVGAKQTKLSMADWPYWSVSCVLEDSGNAFF